jgi:hypothetical protein
LPTYGNTPTVYSRRLATGTSNHPGGVHPKAVALRERRSRYAAGNARDRRADHRHTVARENPCKYSGAQDGQGSKTAIEEWTLGTAYRGLRQGRVRAEWTVGPRPVQHSGLVIMARGKEIPGV